MEKKGRRHQGQAPLVSICCITYNHEAYIRDALEGFLRQKVTFPYEILIYDDASTDHTADIIREYAVRYPDRIRPLLNTENQYSKGVSNPSGAFNYPRARGKYIAMCEGDDYWTDEGKLQMQVDYLESHPGCSMCIHSARVATVDGSYSDKRVRPYKGSRVVLPEEIIDKSSGYAMASLVFPARLVRPVPSFYTDCPVGDIPLQLMAAAQGYGYYWDKDMSVYRLGVATSWTTQSKTGDYVAKQRKYFEEMRAMYRAFDQATGGRYHEVVKSAVRRLWFLTKVNTRRYGVVLDRKYQGYYRERTGRARFDIQVEARLPWLYQTLAWLAKCHRGIAGKLRKKGDL